MPAVDLHTVTTHPRTIQYGVGVPVSTIPQGLCPIQCFLIILTCSLFWCPGWDSNPHGLHRPGDFKSPAYYQFRHRGICYSIVPVSFRAASISIFCFHLAICSGVGGSIGRPIISEAHLAHTSGCVYLRPSIMTRAASLLDPSLSSYCSS